jgi:hypothetical protein
VGYGTRVTFGALHDALPFRKASEWRLTKGFHGILARPAFRTDNAGSVNIVGRPYAAYSSSFP